MSKNMYLDEDKFLEKMKVVFDLKTDHKNNPSLVSDTQKLTLDKSKPTMGLKGTYGLYGSVEWWENLNSGVIPTKQVGGVIEELFYAGMDSDRRPNSFRYIDDECETIEESMYVNNENDLPLFKIGARVEILFLIEELKPNSTGGEPRKFPLVLEMAVSSE